MSASKKKRWQEREAWRELQIVIRGYRALGFDYLINRQPLAKLCFGSTSDRQILPLSGPNMSPLMRRVLHKIIPDASQCKQKPIPNEKMNKTPPKQDGYGLFSSKVPRFQYPMGNGSRLYNPNDFHRLPRPSSQSFGISRGIPPSNLGEKPSATPGPGSYTAKQRKNVVRESFNGKRCVNPATRTLCMSVQTTQCSECSEQPIGDYWQNWSSEQKEALCRFCMQTERLLCASWRTKPKFFKRYWYLEQFERVRHCAYCHEHNGTKASLKLWHANNLRKKFRVENYLAMFEF